VAMETLKTRAIPSTGERLPVIGLGTWQTFDVGTAVRERSGPREVLRELAHRAPGAMVDTSPMYGRSEETIGALVAELGLRQRIFLATKVWTRGRRAGVAQMEDSLRKLGVERVDLLQVHNLVDVDTHLATLRAWKESGRTRYVGITHYTESAHAEVEAVLRREPVDFLQINYSVAERGAERRLLPLAFERGVAVIANRPFTSGGLLRELRARPLPAWAAERGLASWPQLLLAFVISHPAITCAIPATANAAHLEDDLDAAAAADLDEDARERIASSALV
jgi:diketogulonate reductase-like aldo/keto reductase